MSIKAKLEALIERYEAEYVEVSDEYRVTYSHNLSGYMSALDGVLMDLKEMIDEV